MSDDKPGIPKNIGLALGSGSARGWAHIGIIRALADAGIEISCVAGTSIGALVGAAFALNKVNELEDFVRQLGWKQIISFLDVIFPRSGLIDGEKLTEFFRSQVKKVNIEELPLPYCAVATDLTTGCELVLNQGDLIDAIRASISVPGMFTPAKRNDNFLVDGGLVNPVPVSAARSMGADYVIAVDLNHDIVGKRGVGSPVPVGSASTGLADRHPPRNWKMVQDLSNRFKDLSSPTLSQVRQWLRKDPAPNIFDVLTASITIVETQVTAIKMAIDPPDLLVQPKLGHIRFMEFHRAEEAIAEGYREAMAQLERNWG